MSLASIPDFSVPLPSRPVCVEQAPAPSLYQRHAPIALADESTPGSVEPWQAVSPVRPDTPFSRALRVMDACGELLAAVILIGGGAVLTGLASLL